jgi:hypothetical protein
MIVVIAATGCQSTAMPEDPLFLSKKPIESKAELAPPVALVYSEPAMPRDPGVAYAKRAAPRRRASEESASDGKVLPGVLVDPGVESATRPAAHPEGLGGVPRHSP